MKHLTLLIPEGDNNLSSIVGTYKIFTRANEHWKEKHKTTRFQIQLAGLSTKIDFHDGIFSVKPHTSISEIKKTDLIIIPSLNHNFSSALTKNKKMTEWIIHQYKNSAEVASICTGAFLLASTGLLKGRSCSTHWSAASQFKTLFPEVILETDQLITDENGIYTNAYSFLNLILYLIEKYYDRSTAIWCSKVFQIEMDRQSQSPFTIFSGQKQHGDELVRKAQNILEENFQEKISFEELSVKLSVGRRNFDRRFIKATGNTPVEYLQRIKIEAAKKAFETTRKNINEVMYEVGYSDVKAFREVFRKITGLSPLAYKAKYNKDLV